MTKAPTVPLLSNLKLIVGYSLLVRPIRLQPL